MPDVEMITRSVAPPKPEAPPVMELVTVSAAAFPRRGQWRHFWDLSRTLAVHEIRLRYFGSTLGHLWSLLRPLMLFGVMYYVFTQIVRFGSGVDHYQIYLLASLVIWNFFSEMTSAAVTCLVARENLLRKINFPRLVVPFSLTLSALYHVALNAIVVIVFALISGLTPRLSWLGLFPLLAMVGMFAAGISLILCSLYVRYRDLAPVWEVALQILFWASPVIYVASFAPESVRAILGANPLSAAMTQMRRWFVDPTAPSAADVLGGTVYLLVPVAIVVASVVIGALLFKSIAPRAAEEV